jgi:hypothetical protein
MTRRYLTKGREASSAERVANYEDRQRKLGRKGRKVWATIEEHEEIKKLLEKMRD